MSNLISPLQQGGSGTLFNLLSPSQVNRITSVSNIVKYHDGQLIHSRGDTTPGLSIVKRGAANIGVYGADGTFIMASLLGPGESFGEFSIFTELPRTHDVSASGKTEIYQLSGVRFTQVCEQEPEILKALLKSTLIRTHVLLELLDAMRRLPLLERSVKVMLALSYSSGSETHIKCKQTDLAFALGVSRVSLGKTLKQLNSMKLINIGYRRIDFTNRADMEKWLESRSNTPLRR